MARRQDYRLALRGLTGSERNAYLDGHSGLPGPRGNLELMEAAADEGDAAWLLDLSQDGDEFRAATGAVGLGRLLAEQQDADLVDRLHRLAGDRRWRVREGVAMALQRLGDHDPPRLWRLARTWAEDADPLVQRAAAAGVCEPRLLKGREATVALDICGRITASFAERPEGERRSDAVRSLRKTLGYCWSVAVAAAPDQGIPRFLALAENPDPDVAWIVRENRKKTRLQQVLP